MTDSTTTSARAGIRVSVEPAADPADVAATMAGLMAFNRAVIGDPHDAPVQVFLRDADGTIVGGLLGQVRWRWLHVAKLWVADDLRGRGLGTALMRAAEQEARAHGCLGVYLETFEYQARPFYERLGYELFGTLEDYPPGYREHHLAKRLDGHAPSPASGSAEAGLTGYAADLRETVDRVAAELLVLAPEDAARRPSAERWSVQEIVGHLVDSAANNHGRFVRARWQDDLVFPGYRQDDWVAAQRYAEAPWTELVTLWREYNRHLARVMAAVPAEIRHREHRRHNLHEIAWRPVTEGAPVTLDWFMEDYVEHLHHHLRQVRALLPG